MLEELAENDALFSVILARLDAVDVRHLSWVSKALRHACRPLVWQQFVTSTLRLNSAEASVHQLPLHHIKGHYPFKSSRAICMTRFGEEIEPPPFASDLPQEGPEASAMPLWESFPGEFAFLSTWFCHDGIIRRGQFFWKSKEWDQRRRKFFALCNSDDIDGAVRACGQLRCLRLYGSQLRCSISFLFLPIQFWWSVEKFGFSGNAYDTIYNGVYVHCDSIIHEDAKRHITAAFLRRHVLVFCWDAHLCGVLPHYYQPARIDVSFPEIVRDGLFWIPDREAKTHDLP